MSHKQRADLSKAFIELYAGAGGSILGFINAGLKCVAAIEYDPGACWTLWHNLAMKPFSHFKCDPDKASKLKKLIESEFETNNAAFTHVPGNDWLQQTDEISPVLSVWCCDILKLDPWEVMKTLNVESGQLGIISGGPPCQGFSIANSNRHEADPRNQHPYRYLQYVKAFMPRMFMIENVTGIISLGKQKGEKEGPFVISLRNMAAEIGYEMDYQIHNACNYGVPQSRKRVIFVGFRKDIHPPDIKFVMPAPTHTWNFHDAIEDGTLKEKVLSGKQPFVNVQEAIGDLGRYRLSATRDKDAIKQKEGHPDRRSSSAECEVRNGYIWYKDRFTGKLFKGNHIADYGIGKGFHGYASCRLCGKLNLVAREHCHYCENYLYPNLINIYESTGKVPKDNYFPG